MQSLEGRISCLICADVSHALHQFVFECMMLTSVDDAGTFPEPSFERQLDIPWDDPYPYYAGMIPSEPPEDDPMRCSEENNANDDDASQLSVIKEGEFIVPQRFMLPFSYSSNVQSFPVLNSVDMCQEGYPEHVAAILKLPRLPSLSCSNS